MDGFKEALNAAFNPVRYTLIMFVLFALMLLFYRVWTKPRYALVILGLTVAFFVVFMFIWPDQNFRKIVTKPDNVPIVTLIFVLGFFLWWALRQAAINDERIDKGLPPMEAEESNDRVLTWPDLVYSELICMVIFTFILVIWAIFIDAPLEEPANPGKTPNPSKAPWYFLGLQEMLVYFDPWIAGVVLPTMIVTGLIALPFCDKNPKGVGYYTLKERPLAVTTFLFGFLILWISLIIMGTFLRGPNWNFFGPFEAWDVHKLEPLGNVNLSEFFWIWGLGWSMPDHYLVRELPGILLILVYMGLSPMVLALGLPGWFSKIPYVGRGLLRDLYMRIGFIRYNIIAVHVIVMGAMIIKMSLRWTINLKYIVYIPEHFLNI